MISNNYLLTHLYNLLTVYSYLIIWITFSQKNPPSPNLYLKLLSSVFQPQLMLLHSTRTEHNPQTTEKSLGVASTTTTIQGRKGLLFEGRKFTLKFQHKWGISTWRCSTGGLWCKAIASVEIRDNESHIIKMGDHTCTQIRGEESSNITKIKSVVLSANIKSTRSIAAALDVPYNRALYMKRRIQLAKQQTTAADKWWSDLRN